MHFRPTLLLGCILAAFLCPSVAKVVTIDSDKGLRGTTKRILCRVEGETFRGWKLPNGQVVTTVDTNQKPHVEKDGTRYFLVVADMTSKNGGLYTCLGSKSLSKFILNVQLKIDENEIKDQKLLLNKDSVVKLGASGYPAPEFAWTKDGLAITPTGRYQILDDGSLKISNVEKKDKGKYDYKVSQFQGTDIHSGSIIVTVFDPAKITERPKPQQSPSQGFNVTMKCVASGFPPPKYTWKNQIGGVIKSHGRFFVKDGELTILGVLPIDKGSYTCDAASGDGSVATAKVQIVEVYVAPEIVLTPPPPKVVEDLGDSQTLQCTATGTAPVKVDWYKDGVEDERQKRSGSQSTLELEDVRLSDVGNYTCKASNKARDADGNVILVEKSISLHLRSKPVINKKASPSLVYSFIGNKEPVNIRCSFFGYPSPKVNIYDKKNKKVADGTGVATHELTTKKVEMFTTYRCHAENVYGTANHTVKLDFATPPTKVRDVTSTDVTCNAITIKWGEPEKNGGMPVVQYVIQYMQSMTNVDASNTQYTAVGLKPKSDYTFTVWPRNRAHRGPEEEVTVITKEFCRPSRPVIIEPLLDVLEDTTFTLKWRRPEEDGGDADISYKVRYASVATSDESTEKKELKTSSQEIEVRDLELSTQYLVEVFAINAGGESDPATRLYQSPNIEANSRSHATYASVFFTIFVVGLCHVMK